MTSSPFIAGPRIEDPKRFVGRQEELRRIAMLMSGSQAISVNVVGEPRIGKSSLLYHFAQTWDQRVTNPKHYVVIYLSLAEVVCEREDQFYQAVATGLLGQRTVRESRALQGPLQGVLSRQSFAAALAQWRGRGTLAVLCLDDVEILLQDPKTFDDGFFNTLRSLMDRNALMVVIASRKPVERLRRETSLTSSFFQLTEVIRLRELGSETEAYGILNPAGDPKQVLDGEAQGVALQWGGRHPYRLQLAGQCLWQARFEADQDLGWARQQFRERLQGGQIPVWAEQLWGPLRLLLWYLPVQIGQLAPGVSQRWGTLGHWITGITVLTVVALLLIGLAHLDQVQQWLPDAISE